MIRFYLGEEPLLRSVPSYRPRRRTPRAERWSGSTSSWSSRATGFGGQGVTIDAAARRRASASGRSGAVRRRPERLRRPGDGRALDPPDGRAEAASSRHVSTCDRSSSARAGESTAMPGGLTRFAREAGEMVVNSSRGGGCKDTGCSDGVGMKRRSSHRAGTRPLIGVTTSEVRRGRDASSRLPGGRAAAARDGARAHLPAGDRGGRAACRW